MATCTVSSTTINWTRSTVAKGAAVSIDTRGLTKKLKQLDQRMEPATLLKAIGLSTLQWIDENWTSEGGLVGGWEDIQERTKKRKGFSTILVQDGFLRASIDAMEPEGRRITIGSGVKAGTAIEYAATHQYGDEARGIPQRRFLPDADEGKAIAVQLINGLIDEISRRQAAKGDNA